MRSNNYVKYNLTKFYMYRKVETMQISHWKIEYFRCNPYYIWWKIYSTHSLFLKICHLYFFSFIPKNLISFIFIIFSNRSHIPLTHFHSNFILKLIYKSRIHMTSTFSTHFLLHFLKSVPNQFVTNFGGRRDYLLLPPSQQS